MTTIEIYNAAVGVVKQGITESYNQERGGECDENKIERAFKAIEWCEDNGKLQDLRFAINNFKNSFIGMENQTLVSGIINYFFE